MKQATESTKFKFGRNPLSLIIIIGVLGLLFLIIFPIYSYSSTWKSKNVTPFETYYDTTKTSDSSTVQTAKTKRLSTTLPTGITDIKTKDSSVEVYKMKGKDFDLFDLEINCSEYNNNKIEGSDKASFSFTLKWTNKSTEELGDNKLIPFDNESKRDIRLTTCFAADWVGFCKYQVSNTISSSTITKSADELDENYTGALFSSTISGLEYFPAKANTWPVPVSVKAPDLFLYIEFKYQHNGPKTRIYILQYTFDEYNPDAKAGGIYTK